MEGGEEGQGEGCDGYDGVKENFFPSSYHGVGRLDGAHVRAL